MNSTTVQVLVGTAVDTVGQSGNPRTITGFQIQNTPVLLASGEKSELSSEEYTACTDVLEHVVIVKKIPQPERGSKQTK